MGRHHVSARACGVCVLGMVDLYLPPVLLWFFLPLSWFVLTGGVSSLSGRRFAFQPKLVLSLVLAVVAFVAGAAVVGPFATWPLIVPPACAFFAALRSRDDSIGADVVGPEEGMRPTTARRTRRALLGIGAAHLLAIVCGLVILGHTRLTRTETEYICQWSETTLGRFKFTAMRAQGTTSLPGYRYIVEHGSGLVVADAADRLAEIGNPAEDDAVLDRALDRNAADSFIAGRIVMARQRLDQRPR